MQLACPCCGARNTVEAYLQDADARLALEAALSLTPVGKQMLRYIGLFRPGKHALTWARAGKLIAEVAAMIEKRAIERDGITYPAPLEYWVEAFDRMEEMRGKLDLPMKSHGYLLDILISLHKRQEAKQETKLEEMRQRGRHRPAAPEQTRSDPKAVSQHVASMKQLVR